MIELILAALAYVVVQVVIAVVLLAMAAVLEWFMEIGADELDDDQIAFTLKQELSNGYTVYQGMFDKSANKMGSVRRIKAEKLDSELQRAHAHDNLVVYT